MIPKIRHGIWLDEPMPAQHLQWWAAFAEMHPGWELMLWDDSAALDWMQTKDLFDRCRTWAGRSDLLRLELMLKFGGVYADTDVEPLRPMDELLELDRPFAGMENDTLICPTVLGSPPGHAAFQAVLDYIRPRFDKVNGLKPNYQTGPVPLTRTWRHRRDVTVLPRDAFYPVGWWEKDQLGGPYPPASYCVHHWNAGWKRTAGLVPR